MNPIISELAGKIRAGQFKAISLLTGAGVSVNSGIPDFRSPGGMYETLRPELLTATQQQRDAMVFDPTTVVSWDLFRHNPLPYLEVRRPFILGTAEAKWKMTIAHAFPLLLYKNNLLHRLFTQNIDGLDYQSGIPENKIIAVHGSLGKVFCEFCDTQQDLQKFRNQVAAQIKDIYNPGSASSDTTSSSTSTPIVCSACNRPGVKPGTVLYGRQLPAEFFQAQKALREAPQPCDLMIIAGTSLTVYPAANLPSHLPDGATCVVINKERIELPGGLYRKSDLDGAFIQGDCDEIFLQLIEECGWLKDLRDLQPILCDNSQKLLNQSSSSP